MVDRSIWLKAGEQGLLGMDVAEEYGGGGVSDFRYNAVIAAEVSRVGASGLGFTLHNDVVAPYLDQLATEEQKAALAARLRHRRADHRDRDERAGRRLGPAGPQDDGPRATATSGSSTAPRRSSPTASWPTSSWSWPAPTPRRARAGSSLLAVERGMPGFERGRKLDKVGMKAQDTAELFFEDVRVPAANLVGEEGQGFIHLMNNLPQERLSIAAVAVAASRIVLDLTVEYCKDRTAFGRPIGSVPAQPLRARRDGHRGVESPRSSWRRRSSSTTPAGSPSRTPPRPSGGRRSCRSASSTSACSCTAATATCSSTRSRRRSSTRRVQTIYGGTTEIMKEIIGRSLGV